jgi:nucleoside-diphosphate-sugar epimerase
MHLEKRILVAGGAGFLGSHLCERLLAAGADVVCVDCRSMALLSSHLMRFVATIF